MKKRFIASLAALGPLAFAASAHAVVFYTNFNNLGPTNPCFGYQCWAPNTSWLHNRVLVKYVSDDPLAIIYTNRAVPPGYTQDLFTANFNHGGFMQFTDRGGGTRQGVVWFSDPNSNTTPWYLDVRLLDLFGNVLSDTSTPFVNDGAVHPYSFDSGTAGQVYRVDAMMTPTPGFAPGNPESGVYLGVCFGDISKCLSAAAVPEPATWALMLIGIGGLGASLRRRRQLTPA